MKSWTARHDVIYKSLIEKGYKIYRIRGWRGDRDREMAKSKILVNVHTFDDMVIYEHIRCDRWMFVGNITVSETSFEHENLDVRDSVTFIPYDQIVSKVSEVLEKFDEHQTLQQSID